RRAQVDPRAAGRDGQALSARLAGLTDLLDAFRGRGAGVGRLGGLRNGRPAAGTQREHDRAAGRQHDNTANRPGAHGGTIPPLADCRLNAADYPAVRNSAQRPADAGMPARSLAVSIKLVRVSPEQAGLDALVIAVAGEVFRQSIQCLLIGAADSAG